MHRNIIKIVQRALWSRGYRVNALKREIFGFDLLVEERFKVEVIKVANVGQAPKEVPEEKTIAVVMKNTFGKPLIAYFAKGVMSNVPQGVFGLPKAKEKGNGKKDKRKEKGNGKKDGADGATS